MVSVTTYNKLVRDEIPQIIESTGKMAKWHYADENEYQQLLILKLKEEFDEFVEEYSPEELADLIEVIETLKKTPRYSKTEEIREKKKKERGGFEKRIVLESTK